MLDNKGFDLWADGYDKAVGLSDEENTYPFAGYKAVLAHIYAEVMAKPRTTVLDLGFGTAALTAKLYEGGCTVYGQDFSERMLALAQAKMPGALLFAGDLTEGLAAPLRAHSYDFIIATYSLHHLTEAQKRAFLPELLARLRPGGKLLIGDVAFETRAQLEECRAEAGSEWDEDEFYFIAEEMRRVFPALSFTPLSRCAGVLAFTGGAR